MLKLERHKKEVLIRLHNSDRLFNRLFLQAFAFALMIHFLALVVFPIAPFKFDNVETIFQPITVNTDLAIEGEVVAVFEDEIDHKHYLFEPVLSEPALPVFEHTTLDFMDNTIAANLFEPLEERSHFPEPVLPRSSVRVQVSGSLADRSFFPLHIEKEPSFFGHFVYEVQVEDKTGQIFWFAPQQESSFFVEGILKQLQFEPIPDGFVTQGTVEMMFSKEGAS